MHSSEFQRVSRLGSVTARHSSIVSVSQTAGLNRRRQLYTAGRPSRWALAHILVYNLSAFVYSQTPSHCMKLTVLINHITDTAQSQASKLRSHAPFAASVTMLNLNGIERANAQRDGRPAKYRWLVAPSVQRRKVWLTPTSGVPCNNTAKTRNPLKLAGVSQTTGPVSAASGPKFSILSEQLEEILLLNNFFRLSIRALVAKI